MLDDEDGGAVRACEVEQADDPHLFPPVSAVHESAESAPQSKAVGGWCHWLQGHRVVGPAGHDGRTVTGTRCSFGDDVARVFVEQAVSSAVLQPLLPFFFMRQEVVVEFAVFGADGVIVPPPASILQIRGDLPQAQAGGLGLIDAQTILGGPVQVLDVPGEGPSHTISADEIEYAHFSASFTRRIFCSSRDDSDMLNVVPGLKRISASPP